MEPQEDIIAVGCQVEVVLHDRAGNKEQLRVVIVPDESADFAHGYLGENTALAKVMLGERAGTTIPYLKDDILGIEILTVTRPTEKPPEDVAKKREAMMEKTMREVEDTNAMVFASSFSGKWGDYDPDSIPKDKKPEDSGKD
jgi:formate dehydrogenase assembly factor FdhD